MSGRYEIESRITQIRQVCQTHRVARLLVFGSVVREDFDPNRSDIDLLVEFLPGSSKPWAGELFALKDDLEQLFQRKVHLIANGTIRNPYVAATVERDREQLYAA